MVNAKNTSKFPLSNWFGSSLPDLRMLDPPLSPQLLWAEIFWYTYLGGGQIWRKKFVEIKFFIRIIFLNLQSAFNILLFWIIKSKGIQKYALSMISGGALGNLFDRILYRAVPDFIDLHINNFHWFIFNIADIFITIGIDSLWLGGFKLI